MNKKRTKHAAGSKGKKTQSGFTRFNIAALKHTFLAGSALIFAGITFVVTMNWVVMPFYQKTGDDVRTPKVTGRTMAYATEMLQQMHLSIVVDTLVYHNTVPEGVIALQYPLSGTLVKHNRVIKATVSKGARPIPMPTVTGMSQRDAELELKGAGLDVESVYRIRSNTYTRGIVAGQDPQGGKEVPENSRVVLYISNGLPETNVMMPNLIELSLSAARDTLNAYNFNLVFLEVHYEDAPELLPETVIDQHPDPGALTNTNSEVTLDVSKAE